MAMLRPTFPAEADPDFMETRTPVTNTNSSNSSSSSSSSSVRGRHGCVVMCSGNDVHIKLGSSPQLAKRTPRDQHHHHPHQLQQRQDADAGQGRATAVTEEIRQRAESPQPSAPGQQTLLRPWSATRTSNGLPNGEEIGREELVETTRPPPFNPNCSDNASDGHCSSETVGRSIDRKSSEAALGDTQVCSHSTTSGGHRNAMPPPSYDEIYGDEKHRHQHQRQEDSFQTSSVTRTSTDEPVACASSLPCITQFGHYAEPGTSTQPGYFVHPTRISVRVDQSQQPGSPAVIVVDRCTSTVHVFTSTGDHLSLLKVPQVSGGCFVGHHRQPRLLLAVGTSVSVYELDGRLVKEIPLTGRQQDDAVLTTVPYGESGFVAVRSRSLSVCRGGITRPAVVRTLAGRGTRPFVNVVDVAVDSRWGHLLVLDAADPAVSNHRAAVYAMTEGGDVVRAIRPARDGHPLLRPFGMAVDRAGNVLVSDAGRLVQFCGDDGRYLTTLVGADASSDDVQVRGVAVSNGGQQDLVFVVLGGDRFAQVRVLSLQS